MTNNMTEKEKMLKGIPYLPTDSELSDIRTECRNRLSVYNSSKPTDNRTSLLEELFQRNVENVVIEPPFYCDYGVNINLGKNVYMNFNCTILDCAKVEIGENTMVGPNVQIYTPLHPLDFKERNTLLESAKEVTIGKNCWIGGGAIILPNVNIGDGSVIGAGSVVTKDIPANTLAVGNPAKAIKTLNL